MKLGNRLWNQALLLGICVFVSGCGGCSVKEKDQDASAPNSVDGGAAPATLSGKIEIDGSSTVLPISSAVAQEFMKLSPGVKIKVNVSGTGGGFKRFARGETNISDASRPIKDSEIAACKENGIEFIDFTVAIDGLTVVVNKENTWCNAITVAQLKKLWEPDSTVKKWNELDPSWPDKEIKLFGPDNESGTFDYFTEEIVGESKASRSDYTPSVNDTTLVQGVAGEKYALGYFGYAYYQENTDHLKAVAVSTTDDIADAVAPSTETVESGKYTPLSRPLFIYVNVADLKRPEVVAFVKFYLEKGQTYVKKVGYVSLNDKVVSEMDKRLQEALDSAAK